MGRNGPADVQDRRLGRAYEGAAYSRLARVRVVDERVTHGQQSGFTIQQLELSEETTHRPSKLFRLLDQPFVPVV